MKLWFSRPLLSSSPLFSFNFLSFILFLLSCALFSLFLPFLIPPLTYFFLSFPVSSFTLFHHPYFFPFTPFLMLVFFSFFSSSLVFSLTFFHKSCFFSFHSPFHVTLFHSSHLPSFLLSHPFTKHILSHHYLFLCLRLFLLSLTSSIPSFFLLPLVRPLYFGDACVCLEIKPKPEPSVFTFPLSGISSLPCLVKLKYCPTQTSGAGQECSLYFPFVRPVPSSLPALSLPLYLCGRRSVYLSTKGTNGWGGGSKARSYV